jgi:hypothetical protein
MRVNLPYSQPDCARSPSTPALSPTCDRGILVFSRAHQIMLRARQRLEDIAA